MMRGREKGGEGAPPNNPKPPLFPPAGCGAVFIYMPGGARTGCSPSGEKGGGRRHSKFMWEVSFSSFGPPPAFPLFGFPLCIVWGDWGAGNQFPPRKQLMAHDYAQAGNLTLNKGNKKLEVHRGGRPL
eukprot:FR734957.1.p2 GENE.FR734957.1~~FR734957.1.p2  ORF type:complete len:128 (-),score=40.28 FR734957.1:808-1191(-)